MTLVGIIAVLCSFIALSWAFVDRSNRRLAIFFVMLILHVTASVMFYYYVQSHDSDSGLYYFDPAGSYEQGLFSGGTYALLWLVQNMKSLVGGSYLDYFLIFQTIGFWGITLMARTLEEISQDLGVRQPTIIYFILFIPGIYFWTASIYKDGILFLGCSMAAWSILKLQRRWMTFAAAMLLITPFRPHIVVLSLIALVGSLAFNRHTHLWARILITIVALIGLGLLARNVQESMGVNLSSGSSISQFVTSQSAIASDMTSVVSGASLAAQPLPLRLLSLLFRPLFFDVHDIFGLVASFENVGMILMFGFMIKNWRLAVELFVKLPSFRYATLFSVSLIALLSLLYYNVGLGLRQRTMLMPTLFLMFACMYQISQIRRSAPRTKLKPGQVLI